MDPHALARTRGTLALTAAAVDHLAARAHELHRAISDIPFKVLKPLPAVNLGSEGARVLHDGVTDGIYRAVRLTSNALFKAAEVLLKQSPRRSAAALPAPQKASFALSAVSGFVGDYMARTRNPLAIRLGFYQGGKRLALKSGSLREALPQASPRIAIFIHGLCGSEDTWQMYADAQQRPYAERLAADLGYTPLHVRYNSGLHISHNGLSLARQLNKLLAAYPRPIEEISFIGHSMGGLIARAACARGHQQSAAWAAKVKHVICLGAPHRGSPLEKFVHNATRVMEHIPLARPLVNLLNVRARGISDLRFGFTADADWRGRDPLTQYDGYLTPIARLPQAQYHFIGATMSSSADSAWSRKVGDGLVHLPSSTGHELADADTAMLFNTHHMRLLNHPLIYQQLIQRLTSPH